MKCSPDSATYLSLSSSSFSTYLSYINAICQLQIRRLSLLTGNKECKWSLVYLLSEQIDLVQVD